MVALEIKTDSSKSGHKKWECSSECKPLTNFEVDGILEIEEAFVLMGTTLKLLTGTILLFTVGVIPLYIPMMVGVRVNSEYSELLLHIILCWKTCCIM